MSEKLAIESTVLINASAESVWDALVNPAKTKQYMHGCECITNWEVGSSLIWRGEHEGKTMDFVTGIVKTMEPNIKMVFTTYDPFATYPDTPENHLDVTYTLSEAEGGTSLHVVQDGFENAAEGQKRYKDILGDGSGWDPVLAQIKAVVENESS